MKHWKVFVCVLAISVCLLPGSLLYAADFWSEKAPPLAPGKIYCFEESYTGDTLRVDYDSGTKTLTGLFGPFGSVYGIYEYGALVWSFRPYPGGDLYVTYICKATSAVPLIFKTYWVNSDGYKQGPYTLTQTNCGGVCSYPLQESGIDQPSTTGHPWNLGNLCTANVDGYIVQIGVDRWNKSGLTWDIYLWDIDCNMIASAQVVGGTGWYYEDIPPWPVSAGQQFYISYEVSGSAGSYLYRDTNSPANLGKYTVEYASYGSVGECPSNLNGYVVTPVDVQFCVLEGPVALESNVVKGPADHSEPVATDIVE